MEAPERKIVKFIEKWNGMFEEGVEVKEPEPSGRTSLWRF